MSALVRARGTRLWLALYAVGLVCVLSFVFFEVLDVDGSDFELTPSKVAIKVAETPHEALKRGALGHGGPIRACRARGAPALAAFGHPSLRLIPPRASSTRRAGARPPLGALTSPSRPPPTSPTSTALTLLVLPAVYALIAGRPASAGPAATPAQRDLG